MERKPAYESPLGSRYASREMLYLFSPDNKFITWRKLWVALAEAERELGLPIAEAQIEALKEHVTDIDYGAARAYEERVRHDVMAHVRAYADQCEPGAGAILHLGATSCYVTDNTDALILRDALKLIRGKLVELLRRLRAFALSYKDLPTLGLTHLQPAQPVTVGKRATLWMQDFLMDVEDLDYALSTVKLLGSKGTTGTQASFMALFDNDGQKVLALEKLVAKKMGLEAVYPVSGQDLPEKAGQPGAFGAQRHRAERLQVRAGHKASAGVPRVRGALWLGTDRLQRDGLQAKPHALRAHLLAEPPCDGARGRHRDDRRHPVVRAHAGRFRQPPPEPAGGVPRHRRGIGTGLQCVRRHRGLPQDHRKEPQREHALHGHREYPDGGGQGGRGPAGRCTSASACIRRRPRGACAWRGSPTTFWSASRATPRFRWTARASRR